MFLRRKEEMMKIGERYRVRVPNYENVGSTAKTNGQTITAYGRCVYIHPSGRWCLLEFDGWRQCFFAEDLQK